MSLLLIAGVIVDTGKPTSTPKGLLRQPTIDSAKPPGSVGQDVQISLMWDNFNDLDLHCIDPNGERLWKGASKSKSGGELDVEMNSKPPFSSQPVENIYWPSNTAPQGIYHVLVVHSATHVPINDTPS